MERQKKKQKGITLIALVISIIVMLILAGVSLNMTVGDNGIIKQAQKATYAQSIAILEEFLQETYVKNFDDFNDDDTKVVQLQNIYPRYFYIPANEGVGGLRYIIDSDGHALYLIKKSGLPKDISEQLAGGDAGNGTYSDYVMLNDVYGVTSDLKVYYSNGNKEELLGIDNEQLDFDNPLRTVFSGESAIYSQLSNFDTDNDGILSAQELKSIQSLTIDEKFGLSDLKNLYNFTSLNTLTLTNVKLNSLAGIEGAVKIKTIYLNSCVIGDYSALGGLAGSLETLYLYDVDDEELNKVCTDLSSFDFNSLKYFAVTGTELYRCSTDSRVDTRHSTKYITTLQPLSKLSTNTKKAINYLSIQANEIRNDVDASGNVTKYALEYIKDFENLIILRTECNQLTSLKRSRSDEIINIFVCR